MRRYLAIVGAVLIAATACGPQAPTGDQQTASPAGVAAQQSVRGGRIVQGSISDVKTLQPVIATDTASGDVWGWVYVGLVRNNPDTGDLEGTLAEKFTVSPDGKVLTYTLRPNLVWSDGQPFTGEDYKYTVEAVARSKKTVRKSQVQDILGFKDYETGKTDSMAGIVVKDGGKTIEVTFEKVQCVAARNVSGAGAGGILPKHAFASGWDNKSTDVAKNIDEHALNMKPPASMGPFVFKEHLPGVQSTLVANDKYWKGRPNVDEYIVKIYADQVAIKAALLTGEVSYGSVQPADIEEVQNAGREILNMHRNKGVSNYTYIGWNQKAEKAPWLASKQVRQALWYGLDVKTIIDKTVLGYGHTVYAHIPQASAFYEDAGFNKYPYDANKAKQLLESAGAKMGPDGVYRWSDGKPMKMRVETNQGNKVREGILEIATEQYKKIGVQIEPVLESFPALLDRTDCCKTDFEGFIIGWSLGLDPDSAMMGIWHSQNIKPQNFNNVQYKNPELDKLAEQGRFGPDCGTEARKKTYTQVQKMLNEDAPYTFLYTADSIVFANKSIQKFEPKPFSTAALYNIEQWFIKK